MTVYDFEQNTPEWDNIRAGKFTASGDFQVLVTGGLPVYRKLIKKKNAERIAKQPVLSLYNNASMQRGKDLEADAIEAFEMETGLAVERIGFCELSEWVGCSPDGLISDDSVIEVKCKDIHTHLDCFIDGYDKSYKWQLQGNMYVTDRAFIYFVSYNPNPEFIKLNKHLFIEKIERDEGLISQIKAGIDKGIKDIQAISKIIY